MEVKYTFVHVVIRHECPLCKEATNKNNKLIFFDNLFLSIRLSDLIMVSLEWSILNGLETILFVTPFEGFLSTEKETFTILWISIFTLLHLRTDIQIQ